jgi:hypothetical protein
MGDVRGARFRALLFAVLGLMGIGIISFSCYAAIGSKLESSSARQQMYEVHRYAIGLDRSALYKLLKSKSLVATNPAYVHWRAPQSGGAWVASDDGDWPQPGESPSPERPPYVDRPPVDVEHPSVYVHYSLDGTLSCGNETSQQLDFDSADRVKAVIDMGVDQTCL